MGISYKNFWSLNTDEAIVAGILRDGIDKEKEVFFPLNAKMKKIDLVVMNMETKKSLTIQVKGSRAHNPSKKATEEHGDGSWGWFTLSSDVIHKATADYFIFLIYVIEQSEKRGRRMINQHTITIPTPKFKSLVEKYKTKNDTYYFDIWINPKTKVAFDDRVVDRYKKYFLSEYLDERGREKLYKKLI